MVEGDKARVRAADGGMVYVELKDNNTIFDTPYVEFTGTVVSPSTIREEARTKFGASFGESDPPVETRLNADLAMLAPC